VELSGEYNLNASWSLNANYTHNETEQPNGWVRLRRPQRLLNIGASFYGLNERLNVNAFYRVSQDSFDQSGANLVALDDFSVLDLSATYQVTDNIQVYGRLENALDEEYQEILTYNTPGRAGYIGVKLSFEGF
jgi:vitamin B12 transporter